MTTPVAKTYGGALFELAAEEQADKPYLESLEGVAALLRENPEYLKFLALPSIPKAERCNALDQALGDAVEPYVLNFVKLLCERGDIRELPGCAAEFRARYNEAHGILTAKAVTAVPLSGSQTARLREKLAAMTGKQIELAGQVDPECLGGIRLEMDGLQLDSTVQNRLAELRAALANTVL